MNTRPAKRSRPHSLDQPSPQRAESQPERPIAEPRPQHERELREAERRGLAVAVLDAEVRHPHHGEVVQLLVRKHSRGFEREQHVHARTPGRVGHQRKVDELLGATRAGCAPGASRTRHARSRRWAVVPLDPEGSQLIEADRDRLVGLVERQVDRGAQAGDLALLGQRSAARRELGEPPGRGEEVAAQVLAVGSLVRERER